MEEFKKEKFEVKKEMERVSNSQLSQYYKQFIELKSLKQPYLEPNDEQQILYLEEPYNTIDKIHGSLKMIGQFKSVQEFQKKVYILDKRMLQKYRSKQFDIKMQFLKNQLKNDNKPLNTKFLQIIVDNLILSHNKASFIQQLASEFKAIQEFSIKLKALQQKLQYIFQKFSKINTIRNFLIKYPLAQKNLFKCLKKNQDKISFYNDMKSLFKQQFKTVSPSFIQILFPSSNQTYYRWFQTIDFLDQLTYARKCTQPIAIQESNNGIEKFILQNQPLLHKYFYFLIACEIGFQQTNIGQFQKVDKQDKKIPYQAIGTIRCSQKITSIGFLISKNIVMTCAHAIINIQKQQQFQNIIYIINGDQYNTIQTYYPQQYLSNQNGIDKQSFKLMNDFAIIQLENDVDLSKSNGYFGLYGKQLSEDILNSFELIGYENSQQKHKHQKHKIITSIKTKCIKSSYGDFLGYQANTRKGFSGSPGFIFHQDNPFVTNIHTTAIQFENREIPEILRDYVNEQIIRLRAERQKLIYSEQQRRKIQHLITNFQNFQTHQQLNKSIMFGTYIGVQAKEKINKWLDFKKLNLTLYASNCVEQLINIILIKNSYDQNFKIKHLILNKNELRIEDIIKILEACKNLFYMTILQLQGNNLNQQSQQKKQFKQLAESDYFKHLQQLNLNDTGISNKQILMLKQFKYLDKLQISANGGPYVNKINDGTLQLFYQGFKSLKQLHINGYQLNQVKIKELKETRASLKIMINSII